MPVRCKFVYFVCCPVVCFLVSATVVAQPGRGPSPVVVAKVEATKQPASQTFVGTMVPVRKSVIGSAVDGRVTEIFVEAGDHVAMLDGQFDSVGMTLGQPLVQLRTVSLDIEIEAALVELQMREQAQAELKQTLPGGIAAAEATVEEIKARLSYSKQNYDRLKKLDAAGGGLANREIDESFSIFQSQTHLLTAAAATLKRLTSTRVNKLAQAESSVKAQAAEIKRLKELREKYTIRAPFSGYVTAKNTELGQWVSRGEGILEISQLDPIELVINVPQSYVRELQTSLDRARSQSTKFKAIVSVESVMQLVEAEVIQIVPQADLRSRSFPVRIRFNNPLTASGHLFKSGMIAQARLFIGRDDEILLVKKDALVLGGPQIMLYVVSEMKDREGNTSTVAKPVPVKIGASIGEWIQVEGGVEQNDLVVVEGNERLRPMQPIVVAKTLDDTIPVVAFEPTASQNVSQPKKLSP